MTSHIKCEDYAWYSKCLHSTKPVSKQVPKQANNSVTPTSLFLISQKHPSNCTKADITITSCVTAATLAMPQGCYSNCSQYELPPLEMWTNHVTLRWHHSFAKSWHMYVGCLNGSWDILHFSEVFYIISIFVLQIIAILYFWVKWLLLLLSSNKLWRNVETMLCWEGLIGCFSLLELEVLNTAPDSNEIRNHTKPELYGL